MNYHLRAFPVFLLLIFCLSQTCYPQAGTIQSDSTFQAYIQKAWDEVQESGFSDSLQNQYADEFYEYYQQHPGTDSGSEALSSAFTMWGNIGAAEKFDEAVTDLDYDSEMWQRVIVSGSNAYTKHKQRTREEYYRWLIDLKEKLTHPASKSEVLLWLARNHNNKGNIEEVRQLARELIEINAEEFYVNQALGFQQEAENLGIGAEAPDFTAATIDGENVSLSEQKGDIVLLEFWATWCGPCLPEIPHLKTLHSSYSDQDFKIIGVSLDRNLAKLKEFIQEEEIDWSQIYQAERWEDEIPKLYNVYMIPRNYLIGRDGKILAKDLKGETLKNKISELLEN